MICDNNVQTTGIIILNIFVQYRILLINIIILIGIPKLLLSLGM